MCVAQGNYYTYIEPNCSYLKLAVFKIPKDLVEDYARQFVGREKVDKDTIIEFMKAARL